MFLPSLLITNASSTSKSKHYKNVQVHVCIPFRQLQRSLNGRHTYLCFIWEEYRSVGLCNGRAELAEDDRLLGYRNVLLHTVVNVVHPNTDQLLWVIDGRLQHKAPRLKDLLSCCLGDCPTGGNVHNHISVGCMAEQRGMTSQELLNSIAWMMCQEPCHTIIHVQ